jgi:hypothetical protein
MQSGGSGTFSANEIVYQGASLATATARGYVAEWNKPNLTLRIRNIKGIFQSNVAVVGSLNSASWILSTGNTQEDATSLIDDNVIIEEEADNFLDFTETNPFGEP